MKEIYKERRRDTGVEFAKLCNYLAQKFPKEKLRNLKRVLSGNLLFFNQVINTFRCNSFNTFNLKSYLINTKNYG